MSYPQSGSVTLAADISWILVPLNDLKMALTSLHIFGAFMIHVCPVSFTTGRCLVLLNSWTQGLTSSYYKEVINKCYNERPVIMSSILGPCLHMAVLHSILTNDFCDVIKAVPSAISFRMLESADPMFTDQHSTEVARWYTLIFHLTWLFFRWAQGLTN